MSEIPVLPVEIVREIMAWRAKLMMWDFHASMKVWYFEAKHAIKDADRSDYFDLTREADELFDLDVKWDTVNVHVHKLIVASAHWRQNKIK